METTIADSAVELRPPLDRADPGLDKQNYPVPPLLGARDVAFPRLNAAAYLDTLR